MFSCFRYRIYATAGENYDLDWGAFFKPFASDLWLVLLGISIVIALIYAFFSITYAKVSTNSYLNFKLEWEGTQDENKVVNINGLSTKKQQVESIRQIGQTGGVLTNYVERPNSYCHWLAESFIIVWSAFVQQGWYHRFY